MFPAKPILETFTTNICTFLLLPAKSSSGNCRSCQPACQMAKITCHVTYKSCEKLWGVWEPKHQPTPLVVRAFLVFPRTCWVASWLKFSIAAHNWKIHFGRITSLVSIDFLRKINSHKKIGYFLNCLCPNSIPE